MADLIDRLTHQSEFMQPPRPGIYVHAFAADLRMYIAGKRTDAEMIQAYELQGDELAQAQLIKAAIDGKNTTQKIIYAHVLDAICLLLGHSPDSTYPTPNVYFNIDGSVNKARVAQDLEI